MVVYIDFYVAFMCGDGRYFSLIIHFLRLNIVKTTSHSTLILETLSYRKKNQNLTLFCGSERAFESFSFETIVRRNTCSTNRKVYFFKK